MAVPGKNLKYLEKYRRCKDGDREETLEKPGEWESDLGGRALARARLYGLLPWQMKFHKLGTDYIS